MKNSITYLSFKALYTYQSLKNFIMFRLLDPLMHYLFFATIGIGLVGIEYLKFIIIGNIIFIFSRSIIVNTLTMFRMERAYSTLELNLSSPTSVIELTIKRSAVAILDSTFIAFISFVFAYFLFDIKISLNQVFPISISVLLIIFSVLSLSLIFSSVSLLFKNVNLFLNLLLGYIQILCGINFPLDMLPQFINKVSKAFPLTNGLLAIRDIINNGFSERIYKFWIAEFSVGITYFIIALLLVKIMVYLSRRTGALLKEI